MFGRKRIKELEARIKGKDLAYRESQRIIRDLKDEIERLRFMTEDTKKFNNKVCDIMNNKGTIVDKYDKIKALVADYQSNN